MVTVIILFFLGTSSLAASVVAAEPMLDVPELVQILQVVGLMASSMSFIALPLAL